jgi:hypothetical protein
MSWYRRRRAFSSTWFKANHAVRCVSGSPCAAMAPRLLCSVKTTDCWPGRCTTRRSTGGFIPCVSNPYTRQKASVVPMNLPSTYSSISFLPGVVETLDGPAADVSAGATVTLAPACGSWRERGRSEL